jgi:hypothetical protein
MAQQQHRNIFGWVKEWEQIIIHVFTGLPSCLLPLTMSP